MERRRHFYYYLIILFYSFIMFSYNVPLVDHLMTRDSLTLADEDHHMQLKTVTGVHNLLYNKNNVKDQKLNTKT